MAMLQGYQGTVTASGINVAKVSKWTASVDIAEVSEGPFVGGDGSAEIETTTKTLKGTIEAVIPVGKDAGQTKLIQQALALSAIAINLTETSGYEVDVPSARVTGFSIDNDGAGVAKLKFDFKNSGIFTIE